MQVELLKTALSELRGQVFDHPPALHSFNIERPGVALSAALADVKGCVRSSHLSPVTLPLLRRKQKISRPSDAFFQLSQRYILRLNYIM